MTTPLRPDEINRAACREVDPELFFESLGARDWRTSHARERQAKELCASCSIRLRCLDVALANDERFGIFGGLDAGERRALCRRRAS